MAVEAEMVEAFLAEHAKLKEMLDIAGQKGMCVSVDVLRQQTGTSETSMKNHKELFDMDRYSTEALKGTYCTRDAIRMLEEKLGTIAK